MKNKILLIEDDIKPDIKVLDKEVKYSISAIFKRDVQKDGSIIWTIKIQPQTISAQENEMKNPTTKDLYDLIEHQGKQMSDFKSDVNKKLDDHIAEFKSFKSDMLEFKNDMLSLPTISKELKK